MRVFLVFILALSTHNFSEAQDIYQSGVQITNLKLGGNVAGVVRYFRYTIHNDTCIASRRVFFIKEEYRDNLRRDWIDISSIYRRIKGIEYDSIANKTFLYPNARQSGFRTELYDFNLQIDSTNKFGFKLDSIRFMNFMGKSRKLYFLSGVASWILPPKKKFDIWIEGFGSIALDFFEPNQRFVVDGENYNYDTLINFRNQWKLSNGEYIPPTTNFVPISSSVEKSLPNYHISYECDSSIDTIGVYDPCIDNPLYTFKATLSTDTQRIYNCLDTVKLVLIIIPPDSTRVIIWKSAPICIVNYPSTIQNLDYYNSVQIMNKDSSCKTELNSPHLKINCNYCVNPAHNPKLELKLETDTIHCQDSIIARVVSNGEADSLWFTQTAFLNRNLRGHQLIQYNIGNRICVRDTVSKSIYYQCATSSLSGSIFTPSISVYPNPASDILHIEYTHNAFDSYTISSALAQVLLRGQLLSPRTKINIKTLPSGIYHIRLSNPRGQCYYQKLVID